MAQKKEVEQQDFVDDNVIITGGGNVVGGDTIRVQGEVVTINMPGFTAPADLEQLRSDYLVYIRSAYQTLELKGIPLFDSLPPEVPLESIYVPLLARPELPKGETWKRNLAESEQETFQNSVQVEQVIRQKSRIVILGDPGSGKTTLLKRLALQLANEPNGLLPIIIPLNAYADALSRKDRNLQQFFVEYFAGLAKNISNLGPLFDETLAQGQTVVLLDGLDEVQSLNRAYLVSKVEAFANEAIAQGNKVIVTSRIVGYREVSLDSHDWDIYTLLDFDQQAVEQFLSKWFVTFESTINGNTAEVRQLAEQQNQNLVNAINASPSLSQLASNPFLLTVLALLMRYNAALPLYRVELYELYLKIFINTWNRARSLDRRAVGQSLDYFQTIAILGKLALWLKEENPVSGIMPKERLLEWLTDYYAGEEWQKPRGEAMKAASEFLDSIQKSNILVERGQGYFGFVHLTFEDHLAARGLVRLKLNESIATIQKHLQDPAWREVILLAMGIWGIVLRQTNKAEKVARALLEMGKEGILLAGASLEDIGEKGLGKTIAKEIQNAIKILN